MFRLFHNKLTEYSNHYIDWSRVSELLFSGSHRYSMEQKITRGIIAACTVVSGATGYALNDEETTHCSNTTIAILGAFLGFTLSHAIVIYPLIKKRYEMNQECTRLVEDISLLASNQNNSPFLLAIKDTIETILKMSLGDAQHSRASETWGRRKKLLLTLLDKLQYEETDRSFLNQSSDLIVEYLNECDFRHGVSCSKS